MKRLLFLCTGNYYRSRYAELRFNALAAAAGLGWRAESRGLNAGVFNLGPLSEHTINRLEWLGVELAGPPRHPLQVFEEDFGAADLVIALKELEHRPMMAAQFKHWEDRIEYWHVHDIDQAHPDEALALVDAQLGLLLEKLGAGSGKP